MNAWEGLGRASTPLRIDLKAVPGVGAEIVLTVNGELRRRDCSAHTSRRHWSARLRTRGRCSRGRGGRDTWTRVSAPS
jgi:hypothetical protein